MKTQITPQSIKEHVRQKCRVMCHCAALVVYLLALAAGRVAAAPVTLVTENFDSFTGAATSVSSTAIAVPNTESIKVEDGLANSGILNSVGYNGVQLINWASHSAPNCILVRPGSAFRCNLNPRGGTNYTWDFWMLSKKGNDAAAGYRISLVNQGADVNEQDFIIFRSGRQSTTNATTGAPFDHNSGVEGVDNIQAFNGIAGTVRANNWVTITNDATGNPEYVTNNVWNHYRIVANNATRAFAYYVNNMTTPIASNVWAARPQEFPITAIRFANDGNSATTDYYYTLIDDVSLTVDGNLVDLASGSYTDGFESYPASSSATTNSADGDPQGPWITAETAGGGANAALTPTKVQVVDSSVTAPHSGNKCLMVQGGQVGGASISWAQATNEDVRITWWAKVPVTPNNNTIASVYLRVSVYGWEAGSSSASDSFLVGFGHRNAVPNGGASSLLVFSRWASDWFGAGGAWLDTLQSYTPDTWEEYQLTTHVSQNSYTLVKSPSVTPVTLVKDGQFITSWVGTKKMHTVGFSSSNGSGHPPAFVDDITIEPYTNTEDPQPKPYTPTIVGSRFTSHTVLQVPGRTVGGVCVDPRDNTSIIFTIDEEKTGEIRRAHKVAAGNWVLDPTPIVSGLDFPSGVTMETNGTIWWVHDNVKGSFYQALRRLKEPWATSPVEEIISDFGAAPANAQDQPCDVTLITTNGTTLVAVLDRGVNGNNPNAIWLVDPATTSLKQTTYLTSLVAPNATIFGAGLGGNADAIGVLPKTSELATIWEGDGVNDNGVITIFDMNGGSRNIFTTGTGIKWGAGLAVDPATDRIWVADHKSTASPSAFALPQIVSFDSTNGAFTQELTFPNTNPSTDRPDRRINFHDPGMSFSTNGSFLVVSDQALSSNGGRLLIFHNEAFALAGITITSVNRSGGNTGLAWTSGGAVNYVVQRSATVNGTYTSISGVLTGTSYTDTAAPAGNAFYKVMAFPQN